MPYYRFRKRRKSFVTNKKRLQHSPSSMGNSILTAAQLVTFAVVAERLAGTALTTSRTGSDRQTEVQSGGQVNHITWDLQIQPGANQGTLEYLVFKVERSFVTPVVGTDPIPTDAQILSGGLQGSYRKNMPGWVMKYGAVGIAAEQPRVVKIKVNLKKFKKGTIRDGDHIGLVVFNRTGSTITYGWSARYWEYN